MSLKIILVLFFVASAVGTSKERHENEVATALNEDLLEPGPVMLPGNDVEQVSHVRGLPLCTLCEYVMEKLDGLLKQNSTEQEIEEALEQVCSLLPSTVRSECDDLVKEYGPEIIQILAQEMNPKIVCTALRLCQASNINKSFMSKPKKTTRPSEPCVVCVYFVKDLGAHLGDNYTQQEIENVLEQVCSRAPSGIKKECVDLVKMYVPLILKLLVHKLKEPEQVCQNLGLCKQSKIFKEVKPLNNFILNGNATCEVCVEFMDTVKTLAAENKTEEDVKSLLKMICFYMLPVYKQCKEFIDDNVPKLFEMIAKLDSKKVCQELGACSKFTVKDIRCHLGAVYRCSSMRAAKRCNMVKYCKKFAWDHYTAKQKDPFNSL